MDSIQDRVEQLENQSLDVRKDIACVRQDLKQLISSVDAIAKFLFREENSNNSAQNHSSSKYKRKHSDSCDEYPGNSGEDLSQEPSKMKNLCDKIEVIQTKVEETSRYVCQISASHDKNFDELKQSINAIQSEKKPENQQSAPLYSLNSLELTKKSPAAIQFGSRVYTVPTTKDMYLKEFFGNFRKAFDFQVNRTVNITAFYMGRPIVNETTITLTLGDASGHILSTTEAHLHLLEQGKSLSAKYIPLNQEHGPVVLNPGITYNLKLNGARKDQSWWAYNVPTGGNQEEVTTDEGETVMFTFNNTRKMSLVGSLKFKVACT